MSETKQGGRLTLVCEIVCPQKADLFAGTPTLRELIDSRKSEKGLGPHRRYVLERVDDEFVFKGVRRLESSAPL
jgi:hypothetical protein